MSIASVMSPNHLILCCPLLLQPSIFPSIRVFPMSQLFAWGGQSIGVSASISVLPVNIQGWLPLGISLYCPMLSHSVVSDSLWPHGLQHTRLLCPPLSPGVYSNSCPLNQWCYLTISFSANLLLLLPSIFPSIRVFSNESALHIRWPKYWSFSTSPSNEYIDCFDRLAVQGTLKSLL